jgi:LEA14-like dessication related protein
MHKKSIITRWLTVIAAVALFAGCAQMAVKPDQQNFKAPVVTLDSMEVAHAFGYWYFSNKVQPTKGKPDNVGAPLELAFIFNINNPNEYPVKMDSLNFTVAFEEFDLNTVGSTDTMWIPAGKTNQLRVPAHFDVRQSLLSLMVTGGFQLKEKGTNAWAILEKWWTEIPQYTVPVHVKGGSAVFKADGLTKVATFKATFPE